MIANHPVRPLWAGGTGTTRTTRPSIARNRQPSRAELLRTIDRLRWAISEAEARGDHYARLLAELLVSEPGP